MLGRTITFKPLNEADDQARLGDHHCLQTSDAQLRSRRLAPPAVDPLLR